MSNSGITSAKIPSGTIVKNRYSIEKVLGQGGLGRTYLALDTHRFDELCVLKEFAPLSWGQYDLEKSRELFLREAKILHNLTHPQIPKFLACFAAQERLFLVQEYVKGKTYYTLLQERKKKKRAFRESEIITWLMDILPIFEYIHQQNVIHRDVSPDNIMQSDGKKKPVLIDFGVGKLASDAFESSEPNLDTHSYIGKMSFVGKIGYAPREQIGMGICSPSSDLYSLGVTALVLLTGKEPTYLLDRYSLEWRWEKYAQVSEVLRSILNKMIEEQPQERYQSATEILQDIERKIVNRDTFIHPITQNHPQSGKRPPSPPDETIIISDVDAASPQSASTIYLQSLNPYCVSTTQTHLVGLSDSASEGTKPPQLIEETMIISQVNSTRPRSTPETKPPHPLEETTIVSQVNPTCNQSLDRSVICRITLKPKFVNRCRQELINYVGEIANSMIDEILIQNSPQSPEELVRAIAANLPDSQQAKQFIQKLLSA